ncbi:MAG TPA: DUF4386 domain-containing protein [Nocardioidaceae bacterium]|nr:DUF4386 domain-containing protein [Nocardioidaceae bacterium]
MVFTLRRAHSGSNISVSLGPLVRSARTPRSFTGRSIGARGHQVSPQKTARLFGLLFIATFVTSIGAKILFVNGVGGTFNELRFIPGDVSENSVYLGAILEFGVIVTNIATAVVIYPIVRRQSEKVALGFVAARIMESAFIMVGILSIISIVSVSNASVGTTGAEATALAVQGDSLAATYDWAFLFGPGLVVGFGNGLMLGYLMYRSGLMPRRMAMLGLIGGPMLILSFVLILFDVYENGSAPAFLLAAPEIVWELLVGFYCAIWGFRGDSPILTREPAAREPDALATSKR